MHDIGLIDSLSKYIGRTVTIFTTSGGLSGSGFTGVLASVCPDTVKLITDIGAPPSCCVGSACDGNVCGGRGGGYGCYNGCGCNNGCGYGRGGWGGGYGYGGWGYNGGYNNCYGGYNYGGGSFNWLGSVTEIPVCKIASFTHNAI